MNAKVVEVDGALVLVDPMAVEVVRAVNEHNCRKTFEGQRERVAHFRRRFDELALTPRTFCIVLLNVDDDNAHPIAESLMGNQEETWAAMRKRCEVPFARGLCGLPGLADVLGHFAPRAQGALCDLSNRNRYACVVVDYGTAIALDVDLELAKSWLTEHSPVTQQKAP